MSHILQVSEAILENARLMLQTENVQANAEDFKERSEPEQNPIVEHWLSFQMSQPQHALKAGLSRQQEEEIH